MSSCLEVMCIKNGYLHRRKCIHTSVFLSSSDSWICGSSQVLACGTVSKRFDVVLNVLQSLEHDENRNRATEAQSILNGIDLKFVFCLLICDDLLSQMKCAFDALQSVNMSITSACDLVNTCISEITERRCEEACNKYVAYAMEICEKYDLNTNVVQEKRKTKLSKRLQG